MMICHMSVICLIPARLESSRFPEKLLVSLLGKTILQRTYESALSCPLIDAIYVLTDHPKIEDHVKSFGGKVLLTSKKPRNGTERIIEALETYPELEKAEVIFNLQGDHPVISKEAMTAVIQTLLENPDQKIATAAFPIHSKEKFHAPQVVKVVLNHQKSALYFSRSPIPYHKPNDPISALGHLGLYAYRPFFLKTLSTLSPSFLQQKEDLEQLQFLEYGFTIQVAIVEKETFSVDIPEDLQPLENYLCHQPIIV